MSPTDAERNPITTIAELLTLDEGEIAEGYRDGRANEPCGGNRSKAYWHGWRNGAVDGGYAQKDDAQARLARAYLKGDRLT